MTKLLLYHGGNPDKVRVAAINIYGTTTLSGLHIPCPVKMLALSDKNRA